MSKSGLTKLDIKLGEWARLEVMEQETRFEHQVLYREKPEDTWKHLGDLRFTQSLDACFKWLVPRTLEMLTEKGYVPPIMKLFQMWYDELVSLTRDSSNIQKAALALCLAIEKLIDGEK